MMNCPNLSQSDTHNLFLSLGGTLHECTGLNRPLGTPESPGHDHVGTDSKQTH